MQKATSLGRRRGMPPGSSTSNGNNINSTINNNRRIKSHSHHVSGLNSHLKLLCLIGTTLTLLLISLFALYYAPTVLQNHQRPPLPGIPNFLRGKIPAIAPPLVQQQPVLNDKGIRAADGLAQGEAGHDIAAGQDEQDVNHEHLRGGGGSGGGDGDGGGLHPDQPNNNNNNNLVAAPLSWKNPDLDRYDVVPTRPYPYALEVVPEGYDIGKDYHPPGGYRYTEYTTGGTPWLISNEQQQRSDTVARSRRAYVKRTMQFAWDGYVKYAFGMDEVLPQSARGSNNWGGQGITLVDALDTLWLMGMKDEFYQARDWVRDHLSHGDVGSVSVFETTIRDLGGLLAAYDWSGEKIFLDKALDLGHRLIHAFDHSETGLPSGQVSLRDGSTSNVGWTGGNLILAEFGTIQIENRYLSKASGQTEFATKTEHVFDVLEKLSPPSGLFPYFFNEGGRGRRDRVPGQEEPLPSFANDKITFGAMGDSVYEYMLKIWLQGGRTENRYRAMYDKAIAGMHEQLLQTSTPSGLTYIADKNSGSLDHKMDHLVCFMGGLLALGAYTDPDGGLSSSRAQRDLRTAKAITYTCYQMYARMNTGISPEYVQFVAGKDLEIGRGAPHYLLRPEAVESFFVLHYLTGDPMYREWGWEAYQSIERYCKANVAYGSISNVQETNAQPRDKMESFFLAETLKYLYLLFDPDTEVDILHKHVFNTEAHPMRIFPLLEKELTKQQ